MEEMRNILLLLGPALWAAPAGAPPMESFYSKAEFELTADPAAPQWKVKGVIAENNVHGKPTPGHRTEIRSRWTDNNIYFLFICPYEQLNLKKDPVTTADTNLLWDWDVAEVFISGDFKNIKQYKEYQVSPQSEYVDLAINREPDPPVHDWHWNSGFKVKARIDHAKKVWYGEMRIPFQSFDPRPPKRGNEILANLFRIQGPGPRRAGVAWRPTHTNTHHTPEAFGRIVLR
jgi:hypothetical protein